MLRELPTRQIASEPRRRWFRDDRFDLIVWWTSGGIDGFQLCYARGGLEHALTWTRSGGYSHSRVDDGEAGPLTNQTPILVADGDFPAREIVSQFEESSAQVDPAVRNFVIEKTRAYASPSGGD